MSELKTTNIVVVIPVYQHGKELASTIRELESFNLPLIVVNDGSDSKESRVIRDACKKDFVQLLERVENGGKGRAVIDGLELAAKRGFTHAFQIDADGQHDISVIPKFMETCQSNPISLVLGFPRYDDSISAGRRVGRWITHIWVWINSMSFRVKDSMCGFRIYPIAAILEIIYRYNIGHHMEFDVEICICSCWEDLSIINLPVNVHYPEEGRSNFRLKEDNLLLIYMHTHLFFGMLVRSPFLAFQRMRGLIRNFI